MTTLDEPQPKHTNGKTGRRGHGEGSIHQRDSDGRWAAAIDLGYSGGKRRRKYVYGETRAAVALQLTKLLRDRDLGLQPTIDSGRTNLEGWLEEWLETVVRRTRRPNTYTLYKETVRVHIVPILGHKRLAKLRRKDVDAWISDREKTDLAPRTIHRLWAVLHSALEHAVRTDRLGQNPASRVSLPRIEKQEPRAMPREQARRLLEALATEPDSALYVLELTTGLRQGERLGLRWAHNETEPGVDLDRGELRVTEQLQHGMLAPLKRGASRRVLRLRPWVVDALRAHHAYVDRLQLKAGQRWQPRNLVFPTSHGTPRSAGNVCVDGSGCSSGSGFRTTSSTSCATPRPAWRSPRARACSTSRGYSVTARSPSLPTSTGTGQTRAARTSRRGSKRHLSDVWLSTWLSTATGTRSKRPILRLKLP